MAPPRAAAGCLLVAAAVAAAAPGEESSSWLATAGSPLVRAEGGGRKAAPLGVRRQVILAHDGGVLQPAALPRVNVSVFGEAGCPFTQQFINEDIKMLLSDPEMAAIIDFSYSPFGNARYRPPVAASMQSPRGSKLECQHGPKECAVNTLQACAKSSANFNSSAYMPMVFCTMAAYSRFETAAEISRACATKATSQMTNHTSQCFQDPGVSGMLMLNEARATPENKHGVPWVTVNGKCVVDQPQEGCVVGNFLKVICEANKGPTPAACFRMEQSGVAGGDNIGVDPSGSRMLDQEPQRRYCYKT